MQTSQQVSVRLANKPGRLAALLAALAKEKVDLMALCVMDTGDRSTLRFVPDDLSAAGRALDSLNVKYETADVLLAEVDNQHAAFRKLCERLAGEHLNIDYVYGSGSVAKGRGSLAVIKVNDLAKAQRVLSSAANGRQRVKPVRRRPARAT